MIHEDWDEGYEPPESATYAGGSDSSASYYEQKPQINMITKEQLDGLKATMAEMAWQLVPTSPTEAMKRAGMEARLAAPTNMDCLVTWRAMLKAAPVKKMLSNETVNDLIHNTLRIKMLYADLEEALQIKAEEPQTQSEGSIRWHSLVDEEIAGIRAKIARMNLENEMFIEAIHWKEPKE